MVLAVLLAGAVYYFAPWKLFVNTTVNDPFPASAVTESAAHGRTGPAAANQFISYEHATTGTVQLITLTDGGRLVRLADLRTSDGPDVRVYLSEKPANAGVGAFGNDYVELGTLKGNLGNQNYALPSSLNLARYHSVVLWCKRFSVAFAAAPISG